MPLSAVNMVANGHLTHDDVLQFVNVLTGVMTDQPVTIANTLTVQQAATVGSVPLTLGANGVTFIAPALSGAMTFGTGSAGRWNISNSGHFLTQVDNTYDIGDPTHRPRNIYVGTALTAPLYNVGNTLRSITTYTGSGFDIVAVQDLTPVATAQGYVDLIASEACEMWFNYSRVGAGGPIDATALWGRLIASARYGGGGLYWETGLAGSATLSTRFQVSPLGDVGLINNGTPRTLTIGSVNERIRNPANNIASLSIESSDGYLFATSLQGTHVTGNAYFDGANWNRFNVANPAVAVIASPGIVIFYSVAAAANPIAWNQMGTWQHPGVLTMNYAGGSPTLPTIQFPYQAFISAKNSQATVRPVWGWTGDDYSAWYCGDTGILFTNYANTVRIGSIDNGGNLSMAGILQSTNGNLYLVNSSTAATSDGSNLLLYAVNGAIYTRTSQLLVQNNVGAWVNVSCGAVGFPASQLYIGAAGGGPTLVYRTVSPQAHSFEFITGGYAPIYASAFTPASALKFKTNVTPMVDPLAFVLADEIHGVTYTDIATGKPSVGFIAEDWYDGLPEVVGLNEFGEIETLDYDRIGAVTFEALKQYVITTNARLDALERKLAA